MTSPAQHRADARRRKIRQAHTATARDVFRDLPPGAEIVVLTHGQFSLIDALEALLDTTGPADLTVSTWSAAGADLTHAHQFLVDGRVKSIRFVVDRSFATRQPDYCGVLRSLYGDDAIRTTRCHAKFATIRNDAWNLAVRTSMNLNENPRLELIEVSDDPSLAAFLDAEVDAIFAASPPGDYSAELPTRAAPSRVQMGRSVRLG